MADALGVPEGGERYDALLEAHEEGMRVARLEPLFRRLVGWGQRNRCTIARATEGMDRGPVRPELRQRPNGKSAPPLPSSMEVCRGRRRKLWRH